VTETLRDGEKIGMSRARGGAEQASAWKRLNLMVGLAAVAFGVLSGGAAAATITVNETVDGIENGGTCSLREAVQTANTNLTGLGLGCNGDTAGADVILLQGGVTYKLTSHAVPEEANVSGDLDISGGGGTTIRSIGPGLATIDADSTIFPGPANDTRGRAIDILNGAGGVTLERIRVKNGAVTDSSGGGGIRTRASLTLTDSEVRDSNVALFGGTTNFGGGGILVQDPGALTLSRSTVAGNLVKAAPGVNGDSARGGGIGFFSGSNPLNATNSTISGNTVDSSGNTGNFTYAGGIDWIGVSQTMSLTNVTISNNSAIGGNAATVSGGGMAILEANGTVSNATLKGTIVAGNHAPAQEDCTQVNPDDDWISAGGNVLGEFSGCGHTGGSNDLFFANPNLGPLSNYGGLTETQILNLGSPAINHGGTCPAKDQRGFFRAPVAPCDAGAFELNAPASLPTSPVPPQAPPAPAAGATGQRAAALAKCKKKRKAKARKKCKRKARLLPV
jgi:CSLREA domain-containing protein